MNALSLFLGLALVAPVTGELWHLSIFGFSLLPSDILIPVFFALWALDKWKNDRALRLGKIGKAIALFWFVLGLTYIFNAFRFPWKEVVVGCTYLLRLVMYMGLALAAHDLLERNRPRFLKVILGGFLVSFILIVILGFLQLQFFPSFLDLGLELQGWDPHIGRLLSTWFDPNFVGGYLAFMLGPLLALGLYARHHRQKAWFWVVAAVSLVGLVALYYTFSRSAYLALMMTLVILAFLKSRKLLVAVIVLAILGFAVSPRVQDRVTEGWESAKALVGMDSGAALDPTAELRVKSWQHAVEVIRDHPWIGVGYNRYAYEMNHRGYALLSDHDAGGSDSSLLTLWATTGIFGLLAILGIGFVAGVQGIRRVWKKTDFQSYLASGLLAGFAGVMVHAIFVNSLLYALMMGYLWVGVGLLDYRDRKCYN